jgi:carbon starvation protein
VAGAGPVAADAGGRVEDGNDFVPAPAPVVLGGHFTAIAAAGRSSGRSWRGWRSGGLPALLWIMVGVDLHRRRPRRRRAVRQRPPQAGSITQVVREHMTRPAYLTFLLFVWISLIYVVIAFADVTAGTFAKFQDLPVTIDGAVQNFSINGGAVAVGAAAYLLLSVAMGLVLRFTRVPWWAALTVCVALLGVTIWKSADVAAALASAGLTFMDTQGKDAGILTRNWDQALLVYCFVASLVPRCGRCSSRAA